MSYIFEIDNITVWSPALRIGDIYVGFVNVVENEFGIPAGFTAVASDMIRIDWALFTRFVNSILEFVSPHGHQVLALHLKSILGPSIVMLERAGHIEDLIGDDTVIQEARLLGRNMAR